jgi:hypothetical protein
VVLPAPCKPHIIITVGGREDTSSFAFFEPIKAINSSFTILITCWAGLREDKISCPTAFSETSAINCLATFKFGQAFYYHAFFTVTSPILAYIFLTLTVNLYAGKKIIPYPKRYSIYLYVYLGLYLAFAVFRNFTSIIY